MTGTKKKVQISEENGIVPPFRIILSLGIAGIWLAG